MIISNSFLFIRIPGFTNNTHKPGFSNSQEGHVLRRRRGRRRLLLPLLADRAGGQRHVERGGGAPVDGGHVEVPAAILASETGCVQYLMMNC